MGYAKRTDRVQRPIVRELRQLGMSVADLHGVGRGVPDLAVAFQGKMHFVEVKTPGGCLTRLQKLFRTMWTGNKIIIASSTEDVVRGFGYELDGGEIKHPLIW